MNVAEYDMPTFDPTIMLNPSMTSELEEQLLDLWFDVSCAGGSVGYEAGVSRDEVAAGLAPYIERINNQSAHLVTVELDDVVVASCVFMENVVALQAHWMELKRVMVHPSRQGTGLGKWMVDQACDVARDKLGLESVHIHVRSGEGLEDFWERCEFRAVAIIPNSVKLKSGEYRALSYMARDL